MFLFIYRTGSGMNLPSDMCSIATLSALPTRHDAESEGTCRVRAARVADHVQVEVPEMVGGRVGGWVWRVEGE